MKKLSIALLLLVLGSAQAANNWVCPLYEVFDYGDGFSEYYAEFCDGQFGLWTGTSGLPAGDCSTKNGCFTLGSRTVPRHHISGGKALTAGAPFLSTTPAVKNGAKVLSQSTALVAINGKERAFRLHLVIVKGRVFGLGREIDPTTVSRSAVTFAPSKAIKKATARSYELTLGSVTYRVVAAR